MRRLGVALGLLVLACCLGVLLAAPVSAHTDLVSSDPPAGSEVRGGISGVSLEFNFELLRGVAEIRVLDADGDNVAEGPFTVLGGQVSVKVPSARPGRYEVVYRVVAGDGHPVAGTYTFDVTPGKAPAQAKGDAPVLDVIGRGGGVETPPWLLPGLAGAAALVLVGHRLGFAVKERRP